MMDELLNDFVSETRDNLEALTSHLLDWEKNPSDSQSVDSIFRFVHTVKGSCGFLELPRLLELSHAAEDVMSEAREGKILPTSALVSTVLDVVDQIGLLAESIENKIDVANNDNALVDAMYDELKKARITNKTDKDSIALDIDNIKEDGNASNSEIVGNDNQTYNDINSNRTIRVSLKVLDNLMSGVSDLVLARNEVSRKLRDVLDTGEVDSAFGRLSTSVAEMRDAVGLMRMQNIDRLFSSLPRLLRDINKELNKNIELHIDGSEVEIDREMVEALRDPLTHIIRNAADHGIESTEDRLAAGKSATGNIQINARQSGNQILIEIIDDGAGIDINKLRQKVIASKLMSAAKWEGLSEKAKLDMIFAPGLSTADTITSISGRGVGMDVVRNNINRISGSIDVENFEGEGLKITLSLPLTLSIIAGLSIRCGNQMFAISRSAVQELVLHTNKNVIIEEIGGTQVACIRGERLAYIKLSDLVAMDETDDNLNNDVIHNSRTLVVIKPAIGKNYVMDVDAVLDNEELVVKPGAPLLMASGLYAGTSLPDNGMPLLLLDANAIANRIGVVNEEEYQDNDNENEANAIKRKSALLFETLDGTQKAIRLAVLDRLEEVEAHKIGDSGGIKRVKVQDSLYEIFGLEDVPENGMVRMLRLSDGEQLKFLVVKEVLDIFKLDDNIAPSRHPERVEGVLSIFDKQVELLNPYQFFEHGAAVQISHEHKPLCYIRSGENDEWGNKMLLPLLNAAGYRVSTDEKDAENADVILAMDADDVKSEEVPNNQVNLRQNMAANENIPNSIYRYDRLSLLAAIESKISKG